MPELNDFKLDYKQTVIDVNKIIPSPFQVRKFSSEDKEKELVQSILREVLIESIVVRPNNRGQRRHYRTRGLVMRKQEAMSLMVVTLPPPEF